MLDRLLKVIDRKRGTVRCKAHGVVHPKSKPCPVCASQDRALSDVNRMYQGGVER